MGKLLLLALFVLAAVLMWKAFGPASWNRNRASQPQQPTAIKGPDDDEEFLWNIEKNRFKERRRQEEQHRRRPRNPRSHQDKPDNNNDDPNPDAGTDPGITDSPH